jgi:hypothetical protein
MECELSHVEPIIYNEIAERNLAASRRKEGQNFSIDVNIDG